MRPALRALAFLSVSLAALPGASHHTRAAAAAARERFRLEHALTLSSFSDVTWSPDGRKLAFVVNAPDTSDDSNNQDLWLHDLDRGTSVRLTRHAKSDVSPTFSPSGDTIAFVGSRGAGEDAKSAIYMMSLSGGEPWAFGSYDEGVGEVTWSPDGRTLAYVKTDTLPKQVRDWRRKKWDHVTEDERLQYPQLWVIEVATGKQRRLTSGEQYVWYVRWSPDSRSLAFLVSPTGKPDDGDLVDIGVVPVSGGPVRKLGVIGEPFVWSPDGRWIACATSTDRDRHIEKADVWVIPTSGGSPINLTAGFDEDGKTPVWNVASDTLFFHSSQGVTTVVAALPLPRKLLRARNPMTRRVWPEAKSTNGLRTHEGGAPERTSAPATLVTDRNAEAGALVGARNGRVAWVQSGSTTPNEVWIADHPELPGRSVSALNAGIARLDLGDTRRVSWRSTDGVTVGGVLLRPPGAPAKGALKTLVQLHGGPYTDRIGLGFQALPQYFAAHGYQVFMPNFRSSGGYGTDFMVRKRADWGGQDWQDVMTGVDSLVHRGLASPNQLGVFGRSYGGYLTAWAITQTHRFDAACVFAGAVDLSSFYGQSDIQKYRAYEFQGFPWESGDLWARSSPITHIRNVETPTLIQVGENDPRVPYPQAQQLYRALLGLGVPVEFVHYPREGHLLREPRHRADHMARMLRWWDRWVK